MWEEDNRCILHLSDKKINEGEKQGFSQGIFTDRRDSHKSSPECLKIFVSDCMLQ